MFTVVLIIQIMITVALVAVVLLQRSEGGALGIGGGGGGGGLMTGRGAANLLTRTTAILAAGFFLTSILLTVISQTQGDAAIEFEAEDGLVPAEELTVTPIEEGPAIPEDDLAGEAAGADTSTVTPNTEEATEETPTDGPVVPDAD